MCRKGYELTYRFKHRRGCLVPDLRNTTNQLRGLWHWHIQRRLLPKIKTTTEQFRCARRTCPLGHHNRYHDESTKTGWHSDRRHDGSWYEHSIASQGKHYTGRILEPIEGIITFPLLGMGLWFASRVLGVNLSGASDRRKRQGKYASVCSKQHFSSLPIIFLKIFPIFPPPRTRENTGFFGEYN